MLGLGKGIPRKSVITKAYLNTHSLELTGEGDAFNTQAALQTQFRGNFTLTGWFKLNDGRTASTEYWFSSQDSASNMFNVSSSNLGIMTVSHFANGGFSLLITGQVIDDNATDWIHMAVVATKNTGGNTTYAIYKNGVSLGFTQYWGVADTKHATYASTTPLVFGAYNNSGSIGATVGDGGFIDECAFFDAALTSGQINAIYNDGVPKDLTGHSNLYLYYKLNNSVTDEVGNSNGVLVSNAAFSTTVPS